MSDRIMLKGMRFYGFHGALPAETRLGQSFLVDVEIVLNLAPAGRSDDLGLTVDYGQVFLGVKEIVEGPPLRLIEALAERVADYLLTLGAVEAVTVRVHKPQAPLPGTFDCVTVEIQRKRTA